MRIGVIYGGVSGEREVSLSTGKGVMNALREAGHDVVGVDFHPERIQEVVDLDVEVVFIGLHGKYGEDGRIQGLLELKGIPYVGSGVLASALAMDKSKAKQIFHQNGLTVAKSRTYPIGVYKSEAAIKEDIEANMRLPLVIKPNQEGSTLGLTIVKEESQLDEAIKVAVHSDTSILAEEFVYGREVTVAVMGAEGEEQSLPVIEIIPKNEYYDYESKYAVGGSEHICPAELDEELALKLQKQAVRAHQLLGCETYSRVDFIINEAGEPVILEVNTLPGMTPTSLFPDAANVIGLSYSEMIEKFIELTLQSK
ncbi:D-alanine--D-alanine ligase [Pontibacillus halophilus JSM 076056 = DSM 19796]|uniref:D-alanine--D-alanine ligase n=1 Tax=Pontibacillus halophilus JSM 076056 = DSM 19796 TaxID=1385510 RepID=A0A0A5GJL8_9BACI|nr:D-alanine--D-alanine ligase [Pontibacillus halophilus]KGX92189.1 D-alanine--D-alanine ligase [Pontibacillus halophilus JSM 076056 = DSM 19796]